MSRGSSWSDSELSALISIWGEAGIQQQLDGAKWNRSIFERIAKELQEAGFRTRDWKQCKAKLKNIKQDYKKIKDHNSVTGNGRQTSKFFERLDCILGHRPSSVPAVVLQAGTTALECQTLVLSQRDENTEQGNCIIVSKK